MESIHMATTPKVALLTILFFFFPYSSIATASPSTSAQGPSAAAPRRQHVGASSSSPVTHPSPRPTTLTPAPSSSPSPPPTTTPDCTTVIIDNLSPCLTFVEKGSNATVPDKGCCRGLAAVVSAQPVCLCQLLGAGSTAIPVDIDRARALTLPTVCRVPTPPVSLCAVMGAPVFPPAAPPVLAPSPSISQGSSAVPSAAAASPARLPPSPNNSATATTSSMLAAAATIVGTTLLALSAV